MALAASDRPLPWEMGIVTVQNRGCDAVTSRYLYLAAWTSEMSGGSLCLTDYHCIGHEYSRCWRLEFARARLLRSTLRIFYVHNKTWTLSMKCCSTTEGNGFVRKDLGEFYQRVCKRPRYKKWIKISCFSLDWLSKARMHRDFDEIAINGEVKSL